MNERVKRWMVGAVGAAVFAFLGWQAVRLLRPSSPPPSPVAVERFQSASSPPVPAPLAKPSSRKAAKAVRDISRPQPIEIAVATLPLFRTGGQQTRMASGRSRPTELSAWIMGMTLDGQSNLWVATEDAGVWRCPLDAGSNAVATVFTTEDGLGDDHIYAIACDRQGRIWVGHLNHGVSVYNDVQWRNYDVLDGPLGERVFRIKVNPVDGGVWIATSRGLSRYSVKQDTWSYYTRADGLPSDQIQAMAFDKDGTIYAGTQCDGVAICEPERQVLTTETQSSQRETATRLEYRTWRVVHGAEKLPLVASGSGLPTDLINDVLVTSRDGGSTVWVATTTGLAWSRNKGKSWRFVRGRDWIAKVQGLYGGPPKDWQATGSGVLAEDYVNCLAEDPASSKIWLGYRQQGCGLFDPADTSYSSEVSGVYATTIIPLANHSALVGTYADGLVDAVRNKQVSYKSSSAVGSTTKKTAVVSLPSSAKPPTLAEMNAMLKELSSNPAVPKEEQPKVIALDDDWRTQGDWLGRYGRYWACLAAYCASEDYLWGAGPRKVYFGARSGPNRSNEDGLRRWIQWLRTADQRSLEMPPVFLDSEVAQGRTTSDKPRREAEWDDHGEAYKTTLDGPHIYCTIRIPEGVFYLSLYVCNANGNRRQERYRDYRISLRPHNDFQSLYKIEGFEQRPELVHSRIRDFYHGVWKRFLVRGRTAITIEVNRNYSYNTILAGVMVDLIDEDPPPYFHSPEEWIAIQGMRQRDSGAINQRGFPPCTSESEAVNKLVEALQSAQLADPEKWAAEKTQFYTLIARWLIHRNPSVLNEASASETRGREGDRLNGVTGTVFYNLGLYSQWEEQQRKLGLAPARDIEKALRWDGKTAGSSDKGYTTVEAYLSRRKPKNSAGSEISQAKE